MIQHAWLVVLCLIAILPGTGLAQTTEGCEILVTNPKAGDLWVVGQRYSLVWESGELCPQSFTKIELIGRQINGVDKIIFSRANIANTGWLLFTPTSEMLGYPGYVFRFWGVGQQGGGQGAILGLSEVFQIAANNLPPLVADPLRMTFFLASGAGSQSQSLYLIANRDRVDWTAASSKEWLTVQPSAGTVSNGAGAAEVAVSVNASGLATGRHEGAITFTVSARADAVVTIAVDLVVSPETGGTPRLETNPAWFIITHRLEESYTPRRFTLTNTGDQGTDWSVETGAKWLTISPSGGHLEPGASVELVLLVSRAFSAPGSHRAFARFRGRLPAAVDLPVELNLIAQAGPATWPPAGKKRLTLPVASHAPGAENSFWLTDATAIMTDGTAQAAHARYKIQALEALPGAVSMLGQARLDALMAALEQQSHATASRGTTQFIWGALGGKKARATEAVVMETPFPDDRPTLYSDIMGQYFGLTNAFCFLQMAGERAQDALLISRTYTTATGGDAFRRGMGEEQTFGQSVQAPADPEIIGPEGGTAYVPGLRYEPAAATTKGWRSNLFITEIGGIATPVTIQLFDVHGIPAGNALTKTLEPFTQWPLVNTALTFNTTLPWTYAAVTSAGGGQIVALGSVVDSNSNDPTTINGLVASPGLRAPEDLILPAAVRTPGNFGTTWRSDVTLLNASGSPVTIQAQFIPMAGSAGGIQEASIPIEAHGMAVYSDIVLSLFGLETGVGSLRLTPVDTGAFFAFNRIYNLADNGFTYGQGTSAYRAIDAIGVDDGTLYTLGLERSPQYRTNAGVVETAGASATVLFTVISPSGESRGYLARLAARQWLQADDIIRDKAGFTEDLANAWIMINVVEGAGRVVGYGSIIDNFSGDATYIKLEKR